MKPSIPDEHVAIVATRAEWAAILLDLQASKRIKPMLDENPETMAAAKTFACQPGNLVDKIAIVAVDTQLRIERGVLPNMKVVKVLKSETLMRPAWEVED